ncbi:MAG: hypothetical protein K8963_09360 [Proteobacteria bacterium]|nr:hypothetical protein [Pseudomonadota bacterium]
MNKWYFIVIGVLAVVGVGFVKFVLPYWGFVEMGKNLSSGDPERIAQAIDFESLRRSLLEQYQNNKDRRPPAGVSSAEDGDKEQTEDEDGFADKDAKKSNANSDGDGGENALAAQAAVDPSLSEPVTLPVPVENSTLGDVINPLISADKRSDARVQAMLNDALSADGINRLLNGEMTQYNNLAREVFPPHLVDMAMQMTPADVRSLIQNARTSTAADGTQVMSVDMPNEGGELQVTLRQNGSSYQIVDLKVPTKK